jgi:hypothetical protein
MKDPLLEFAFGWTMGVYSPSFQFRLYVHELLFGNTIEFLGSDEQWKRYRGLTFSCGFFFSSLLVLVLSLLP